MEAAKNYVLERQHASMRLNQVFSAIPAVSHLESSPFYTEEEKKTYSLHFLFDNGIDPDPLFSGPVRGKIFLEEDRLWLEVQPIQKNRNSPLRKEILLDKVKSYSFTFLAEKEEKFPDPKAEKISADMEWRSFWPKEKPGIPSLIRLELIENISQKDKKADNPTFAFFLLLQDIPVTYR